MLGQGDQVVLEAEAMDLDVGQDHRLLGLREQCRCLVEGLAERIGVARRQAGGRPVRRRQRACTMSRGSSR